MDVILLNAHTQYAKGATVVVNEKTYAEYDLSVQINKLLTNLLCQSDILSLVIDASHITPYNKSLSYKAAAVNAHAPKIALETHFNAGPNKLLYAYSSGVEILYTERNNKQSKLLALSCINSITKFLPFKLRRGGTGLYQNNKIYLLNTVIFPIVLIEICFLTHPIDRLFLLHPRALDVISYSLYQGIIGFLH